MENRTEIIELIRERLQKADEAFAKALSPNESIYYRAQKEAYIELLKALNEDL